ncbi:hypothetical protein [Flavobacterium coralii]|uniref:hypothetical protein n=1 Tax=Flavobacterium coralii TaxID=2838017 RepID=UPI0026A40767|tara:strand:+ start:17376 stop:17696 length:321 start_codon:yes stop_codon:yes gene_type:complete
MKKLLSLLLISFSFMLLSCSDKKEKGATSDEKVTTAQEDSPCKTQYEECIKPLEDAYAKAVEKAADKLKADSISKNEYTIACDEAFAAMQNEIGKCDKMFKDCLLK